MDELYAGFNVSLFAYGQTGSGKTHTMFGSAVANEPGLIELLLSAVHKRSVRANPSFFVSQRLAWAFSSFYSSAISPVV